MKKQYGVTLVSMMIGVVIGIFVTGAVIKIYVDSKNSFNLRSALASVAETQRFALDDMRRILVMAGRGIAGIEDNDPDKRAFPILETNYGAALAEGAEVMYDSGNSLTESDVIAVRYRIGPSCGSYQNVVVPDPDTGNDKPDLNTRPSVVRFYINSDKELICELTNYQGGKSTTAYVLAENIQLMKAIYGVDEDNDNYADRYLTATAIENELDAPPGYNTPWARVKSIRIAMVIQSDQTLPKSARKLSPGTLNILGLDYIEPDTAHLYKVASTTLVLRNLNPTVQRQ